MRRLQSSDRDYMVGGGRPIYLDHNATTPVDPRVREAMLPYLSSNFGNPASRTHVFGRMADYAVEVARQHIADLIGARDPGEIIFTGGATQSIAMALRGVAAGAGARNHIITTAVEHQAVLDTCEELQSRGFQVTYLAVTRSGHIDPDDVAGAINERTLLVSIMLAQNVIGTIQPIKEIAELTASRGIVLHVDAAQGVGLVPFQVAAMGVDLTSLSAHKLYGPKGSGALYIRRGLIEKLDSLAAYPGHENHWHPGGTLNVPGIVGFGRAAQIMMAEGAGEAERLHNLRERLYRRLIEEDIGVELHGDRQLRHPGNLNIYIPALGDSELARLRAGIAISHGSACTSGSGQASHVLLAMGIAEARARTAIRIGIGRFNTREEIDTAAGMIVDAARAGIRSGYETSKDRTTPRTVVDCQGRQIEVFENGYTSFCWVSNTDNFLRDLGEHSIDDLCEPGVPPRINVFIPSYCSGPALAATLLSLLTQTYVFSAQIIVFINEPPHAAEAVRESNQITESWLASLTSRTPAAPGVALAFGAHDSEIRGALAGLGSRVRLRVVRGVVSGGMPAVYQAIISSVVRRLRDHYHGRRGDRSARSRMLDDTARRTLILICDDDIEFADCESLERAYYHATVHDAVVLGRLAVNKPPGLQPMDDCLHDLMQLFLDMKDDLGANSLAPRGLLVRHALEAGSVARTDAYGDQLYFARIASGRPRYLVHGTTTIREVDYPSNGRFMRDLRMYLAGADNDALDIFRNLAALPGSGAQQRVYSAGDITRLIATLETRSLARISAYTHELLCRFNVAALAHAPARQEEEARHDG